MRAGLRPAISALAKILSKFINILLFISDGGGKLIIDSHPLQADMEGLLPADTAAGFQCGLSTTGEELYDCFFAGMK